MEVTDCGLWRAMCIGCGLWRAVWAQIARCLSCLSSQRELFAAVLIRRLIVVVTASSDTLVAHRSDSLHSICQPMPDAFVCATSL